VGDAANPSFPLAVAGEPSLAGRDALFALLAGESLPRAETSFIDFPTGTVLASGLDSPSPLGEGTLTTAGKSDGPQPLDPWTSLGSGSRTASELERSALDLLDNPLIEEASLTSPAATDSFFAGLMEGTPAEG
jgi:hypothetical protein